MFQVRPVHIAPGTWFSAEGSQAWEMWQDPEQRTKGEWVQNKRQLHLHGAWNGCPTVFGYWCNDAKKYRSTRRETIGG